MIFYWLWALFALSISKDEIHITVLDYTVGNSELKFKEIFEEIDKSGDKKLSYLELDQFFYQVKGLNILREMSESEQSK